MACNQQHHPFAAPDRLVEPVIDRPPGAIECHAVKIDDTVRLDAPAGKAAIPAAVEGGAWAGRCLERAQRTRGANWRKGLGLRMFYWFFNDLFWFPVTG